MKIIVENHIPYIAGLLEPYAEVAYLDNNEITPDAVADADALVVRTRTRCNEALLLNSRCRFVATATIGTDHIDLNFCHAHGITVANAPGCNAPAVAQYVLAVIARWMDKEGLNASQCSHLTLGIVGVGHVGSIVARWARQLGFNVLLCDPPRARKEGADGFADIHRIAAEAHIITFHTPFTREGEDATFHLCDEALIDEMKHCKLLINSARGGIVDNIALADALECRKIGDAAIDCWENEPHIDSRLLNLAFVATPHIAGYSAEGKRRATAMTVEALNAHFGFNAAVPPVAAPALGAGNVSLKRIAASYNPIADTAMLRRSADNIAEAFESLRNHYHLRHEVPEGRICVFGASSDRIDDSYKADAMRLGELLASAGMHCVNGAGREGVMRAVTDGVLKGGGVAIGVIPQFMVDNGWNYNRLSETIVTADMAERKRLMTDSCDAVVALPGGCGTLEELLEIITRRQLGLFCGDIIILNTGGFFRPLIEMLHRCISENFMRSSHRALWFVANSPEEVMQRLLQKPEIQFIESKY